MQIQQKITPFLGFKDQAEEAAEFYVSILPNSKVVKKVNHPSSGEVLTVDFELSGMNFIALNAGQDWKFTEAVSLAVGCDTQAELDTLWESLSEGGREIECSWLQDKFGVFWQLHPAQLGQWMRDPDPKKVQRMMEAVWQMKKPDIATIQAAFDG